MKVAGRCHPSPAPTRPAEGSASDCSIATVDGSRCAGGVTRSGSCCSTCQGWVPDWSTVPLPISAVQVLRSTARNRAHALRRYNNYLLVLLLAVSSAAVLALRPWNKSLRQRQTSIVQSSPRACAPKSCLQSHTSLSRGWTRCPKSGDASSAESGVAWTGSSTICWTLGVAGAITRRTGSHACNLASYVGSLTAFGKHGRFVAPGSGPCAAPGQNHPCLSSSCGTGGLWALDFARTCDCPDGLLRWDCDQVALGSLSAFEPAVKAPPARPASSSRRYPRPRR